VLLRAREAILIATLNLQETLSLSLTWVPSPLPRNRHRRHHEQEVLERAQPMDVVQGRVVVPYVSDLAIPEDDQLCGNHHECVFLRALTRTYSRCAMARTDIRASQGQSDAFNTFPVKCNAPSRNHPDDFGLNPACRCISGLVWRNHRWWRGWLVAGKAQSLACHPTCEQKAKQKIALLMSPAKLG
jgi:hypothetical protein